MPHPSQRERSVRMQGAAAAAEVDGSGLRVERARLVLVVVFLDDEMVDEHRALSAGRLLQGPPEPPRRPPPRRRPERAGEVEVLEVMDEVVLAAGGAGQDRQAEGPVLALS